MKKKGPSILLTLLALCLAQATSSAGAQEEKRQAKQPSRVSPVKTGETGVSTMPAHAVAMWHMSDEGDATGTFPLAVGGAVELGVPLEGAERAASLARGGDGRVARLSGGHLGLSRDAELALGGRPFTVAIRMRDTKGTWQYPILGSYGSDREVSLALRALDGRQVKAKSGPRSIHAWLFRDDGPRSIRGRQSMLEVVWGAEKPNEARVLYTPSSQDPNAAQRTLAADIRDAVMRTCFPVALIDPTAWCDIVVSFTGPKLELWIDGVLVDEEYPLGTTRKQTRPFLIGAAHEGSELKTGFHGLIDHVAVWNRALTADEITAISGGAEHVRKRELAILGDESSKVQYFRSRGHNRKAGDCIPYWDEQTKTFRLFYLIMRRNQHSKWDRGHGGLEIWQTTTQDLKTWQHHPVTLPITEQWEAWNGTGGVGFHKGRYHWFYPTSDYDTKNEGIQHAVSTDGVHFEKTEPHPFMVGGDCEIYEDDDGLFHLLKFGPERRVEISTLRDKTLVAWVRLADLDQRGGSVLTIEHPDGRQFDGIVFGQRTPRRWMPGSNELERTPADQDAWPEETAPSHEVVQIAIAYASKTVTLYRNGSVYVKTEVAEPVEFPAGSSLIIGLRYGTPSPRAPRFHGDMLDSRFHGDVLDARVYDTALSEAELRALQPNAPGGPKPLAWFDFSSTGLRDRAGTFFNGTLEGSARIADDALQLDDGYFRSLGWITTLSRLTSRNLLEWTPADEPFIEIGFRNVLMCPHLFRFGDWYYFIGGNRWFRSRSEFGPWKAHEPRRLCDLYVPKTAMFGPDRRIYAGFLRDGGWGGNEVLRELVQDENGWLGLRFIPEMIPACGEDMPVTFTGSEGAFEQTSPDTLRLAASGAYRAEATIGNIRGDCRIQLEVVPGPGVRTIGLELRAGPGQGDGCLLTLDPGKGTVAFSKRADSAGNTKPGPVIDGVRSLDKPFTLDMICRYDIIDAEVAGFRATCTRFWNPKADRIRLFTEGGAATFRNVRIRRITDRYVPYPAIAAEQ